MTGSGEILGRRSSSVRGVWARRLASPAPALVAALLLAACGGGAEAVDATVATVQPVRAGVQISGRAALPVERVGSGVEVGTGRAALARLDLDGGAWLLVGEDSRVVVHGPSEVELAAGRVFASVEVGDERLRVRTPRGALGAGDADLSIRLDGSEVVAYVVRGEAGHGGERSGLVRSGEQVVLGESGALVTPLAVWTDWTGGLAVPGPIDAAGPAGMGTLEARAPGDAGQARTPLVVKRLEVRVRVQGDLAITEVDQIFWNPTDRTVEGLYRIRTPEGAVLQRFAIDRGGRMAEAFVRERALARAGYEAQVYAGSTDDPALLEWDAPGAFRARIYPIGPRESRRIVVRYGEWLVRPATGAVRLYRYPMAAAGRPPLVEDFALAVDLAEAGAGGIRAGLGATLSGETVLLRRTDFRPQADFWLELADAEAPRSLLAYRAPHVAPPRAPGAPPPEGESEEPDYFLLPLTLPLDLAGGGSAGGLDVVVVADVSAATDPSHLELGQSLVEALAGHLGPEDRLAVVASDLSLRSVVSEAGGDALGPATAGRTEQLLGGLARVATGGATDLGTAFTAAGDLLDPARPGAIVYVGDAAPTVGELGADQLLERVGRIPPTARLYGVAVGSAANLELLAAVSAGRGLAMRIEERRGGAEAALRILAHLGRPMARGVSVHLGAGTEGVYPAGEADVLLGDVLAVVGRVRGGTLPTRVRVTGAVAGQSFDQEVALEWTSVRDGGDLRSRWAIERLGRLLGEGVPRETIVDLGIRTGLVTPFTSFYVPSARELASGGFARLLEPLEVGPHRPASLAGSLALALHGRGSAVLGPLAASGCEAAESLVGAAAPAMEPAASPAVPTSTMQTAEEVTAPPSATPREAPRRSEDGFAAEEQSGEGGGVAASSARARQPAADDLPGLPVSPDAVAAPASPAPARAPADGLGPSGSGRGGGGSAIAPEAMDDDGSVASAAASLPGQAGVLYTTGSRASRRTGDRPPARPEPAGPRDESERDELEAEARGPRAGAEVEQTEAPEQASPHRPRRCSPAADLPLGDRRALWLERLQGGGDPAAWVRTYRSAVRGCEAPSWRDRAALLDLLAVRAGTVERLVAVHEELGDSVATPYLQRAILRMVRTPADLVPIRRVFGGAGRVDWPAIEALVASTRAPEERVTLFRRLLSDNPGNLDLTLRLLAALEETGRMAEALRVVSDLRGNRMSDAEVRTAIGEVLIRRGEEAEARRVFSEMVEFAPYDALARRRLGDLCRAHGWWEDAYRQYQTLGEISPDDPSVRLLLAAAAAGAGRVDEALRLEQRVAESPEPGSGGGLARAAVLLSSYRLAKLRAAAREAGSAEELAALVSRTRRSAVLREAGALRVSLVWAHPQAGLQLWAAHPGSALARPRDLWPDLGVEVFDVEDLERGPYRFEVRRTAFDLETPVEAELVVVWGEGSADERIAIVPLRFDRGRTRFAWTISERELVELATAAGAPGEVL